MDYEFVRQNLVHFEDAERGRGQGNSRGWRKGIKQDALRGH